LKVILGSINGFIVCVLKVQHSVYNVAYKVYCNGRMSYVSNYMYFCRIRPEDC